MSTSNPPEDAKFIPADGAPIETAPKLESSKRVGIGRSPTPAPPREELVETLFSAEAIKGHTTVTIKRPKLTPPHPVQFENGMRGLVGSATSGVMVSPAFGRTYGDIRKEVMAVSDLMGRIYTQFQRVAFEVGSFDSTHMEYLAMAIFKKVPDVSPELVLSCMQVSTLAQNRMNREELTKLLANLYELVDILNPRARVPNEPN